SYSVITDKLNWVELTTTFIPDSTYTNVTIGNFKTDALVNTSVCPYHGAGIGGTDSSAYYYVDSVSVEKISPTFITNVNSEPRVAGLYPNPAKTGATLYFDNIPGETYVLTVTNISGQ